MIFNKNRVSFHLLWKENLVKHQKVSKYYDHLQNFLLLFRSLLTAQIAKTVIFWVEFTLFFSKDVLDQTWTSFKFRPQWKDRKSSYQVRPILTLFCNLFPLILGWKCVEDQEIIKIVKQISIFQHFVASIDEVFSIIMFITSKHALFHFWRKENLVKHQKVRKYYDHDRRLCTIIKIHSIQNKQKKARNSETRWKITEDPRVKREKNWVDK